MHTATHFCHLGKSQDSTVQLWSSSSQFSDKDIILPPQPRVGVMLQLCLGSPQVREPKQKPDLVTTATPSPHWPLEAAHIWFHMDVTVLCNVTLEWSNPTSWSDPGVPEKAWTTSPRLFQASQQLNSAAQTSPVPCSQLPSRASLPGMHLRPAAPSPMSTGT